ncbi:hypothetical protein [Streptosporangium roseum]|uniref:hypothetical protein n=1 Tax=Streptosporangium roseum TaxID=2001 RepID=UPI0033218FE3
MAVSHEFTGVFRAEHRETRDPSPSSIGAFRPAGATRGTAGARAAREAVRAKEFALLAWAGTVRARRV